MGHMPVHGSYACGIDHMATESYLRYTKSTLALVNNKNKLFKIIKIGNEIPKMLTRIGTGHVDVIQVNEYPIQAPQDSIHLLQNAWAMLARAKGVRQNSKMSKGVITAVLGLPIACTGIW